MCKAISHFCVSAVLLLFPVLVLADATANKEKKQRWYSQQQVVAGEAIFKANCAVCHGVKAEGIVQDWKKTMPDGSYPPPPLNGTAHAWHHSINQLLRSIRNGGIPFGGKMPAFKDTLSTREQLASIAYFQQFWPEDLYQGWLSRGGLE